MSMREERPAGDLSSATASSFKIGLLLAAAAAGVALLLCGGVAGYVAWTGPPIVNSPTKDDVKDPQRILALVHKIVDIDIPADFVPLSGDSYGTGRTANFGRKSADGALLKLTRMEVPTIPGEGAISDGMLLEMTERGDDLTKCAFVEMSPDSVSSRELTVLGNRQTFHFLKGKRKPGGQTLRKVKGTFTIGNSRVALVYTIPEEEYDEDAVVHMIESIRAPEGEAADGSGPSSNSLPATKLPHAEPANGESGRSADNPPADDAQPAQDETPAEKGRLPD